MGAGQRIEAAVERIRQLAAGLGSPEAANALNAQADEILRAIPRGEGLGVSVPRATPSATAPVEMPPTPAPTSTPTPQDASQVYVSAPAAGAIGLIGVLVGAAGGVAAKTYFDKRKTLKAAREHDQLEEDEDDE